MEPQNGWLVKINDYPFPAHIFFGSMWNFRGVLIALELPEFHCGLQLRMGWSLGRFGSTRAEDSFKPRFCSDPEIPHGNWKLFQRYCNAVGICRWNHRVLLMLKFRDRISAFGKIGGVVGCIICFAGISFVTPTDRCRRSFHEGVVRKGFGRDVLGFCCCNASKSHRGDRHFEAEMRTTCGFSTAASTEKHQSWHVLSFCMALLTFH